MALDATAEAFFLPATGGQRFCLFHRPIGIDARAALIFLHPFGEEMNKSRRMVALQSRVLAAAGCAVLQIDLHGCGDSSGDFVEASWDSWLVDVGLAHEWLRMRTKAPLWLWGLRSGCLLAGDAAARLDEPVDFLFWQPVVSGKQFLQQFLRLKTAGEMLGGEAKETGCGTDALRRQLADGEAVEVAGYRLAPGLAAGLERVELALPERPSRIEWLEMSAKATREEVTLMPMSTRRLDQWRSAGHRVRGTAVCGPSFWMTTEITESPALIAATLAALDGVAG